MKFGESFRLGIIFAKDTIGKQLVRAADSIGANIAEAKAEAASKTIAALLELPEAHCRKHNIGCVGHTSVIY